MMLKHSPVILLFVMFSLQLISGYLITFLTSLKTGRIYAWGLTGVSVATILLIARYQFDPFRTMVALIFGLLFSIKGIVHVETVHAGKTRLTFFQYLCFSTGWLGMRPYIFHTLGKARLPGTGSLVIKGSLNILLGAVLIILGHYFFAVSPLVSTICLLTGLSLMLHFGVISLQTGFWRCFGAHVQLLFKEPFRSKSLGEFWSHRWNLAFSEMTSIAIYRPAKPLLGPKGALWLSFLISGLFHEFAISVPVNKGYGLPLLFFLIQAAGISFEQYTWFKNLPLSFKRLWTFLWLLLPTPLLFHGYFIKGIVWKTLLP